MSRRTASARTTCSSRSGCSPTCAPARSVTLTTSTFHRWYPRPAPSTSTAPRVQGTRRTATAGSARRMPPTTSASGVISRGHSEQARERPAKLISGAGTALNSSWLRSGHASGTWRETPQAYPTVSRRCRWQSSAHRLVASTRAASRSGLPSSSRSPSRRMVKTCSPNSSVKLRAPHICTSSGTSCAAVWAA